MSIRLGGLILGVDLLVLPVAFAFFAALGWRSLHPRMAVDRRMAATILLASAMAGLVGGWLYALAFPVLDDRLPTTWSLRLGTLGGYWGVLVGAALAARYVGAPAGAAAGAMVPGLLAGGIVMRFGCLFAGCCRGQALVSLGPEWLQPFRMWPAYDILALALTLALARCDEPRRRLAAFVLGYGLMRFALEFVRADVPMYGPFTVNQVFLALQLLTGIVALAAWRGKDASAGALGR